MEHHENVKELNQVLDFSIALFEELYQESKQAPYITMMGLFAAMVEQCQALGTLLEQHQFAATQSITRNVLEIYVDIINVKKEGNYVNYLWAEYYNREKELVKAKTKQKQYRKLRNDRFSLYRPSQDFYCLTISEKFTQADLKDVYSSVYCILSAHTHSGVFSLLNRITEDGKSNKLSNQCLFKKSPSEIEFLSIPLITHYLLDACEIVAKGHGDEPLAIVQEIRSHLTEKPS
ncbi:DUF5677 domain-containing protein [Colwellia piezophila]|uniref:DUF5677 domain-containing protein n=1 Tax=Colwellia piezophila TaxID=211668 RepID=UPI00036E4A14|nr:DUF5677 domain-containing protein [Colwellia piezophila]